MKSRHALYFVRPHHVEVREETIPKLAPNDVQVRVTRSAISAGTELLFYRGQVPHGMAVDAIIDGMEGTVKYPLTYGYCCVGEVIAQGSEIDTAWVGRRVFAFHPHASVIFCPPSALIPIPDDLGDERALFLPTMETAVNFVMDARPVIGQHIMVMGLGIVGLLTAYLLHQFPLGDLVATDAYAKRLALAQAWNIRTVHAANASEALREFNPDTILEISSNPAALVQALELAGFGTRIIVGSWYGDKRATLPLGEKFHRNRIELISSQVSTVDGRLSNRWDKARRLEVVWQQLRTLPVDALISHTLPIARASEAFDLLDQHPDQALQVILTY